MKNLKKVLCLVLVFAMAFGLMISASAATSNYSDQNNIKHTDAVALLDSLNIMAGHADGSFAPDDPLTRAQVAKMVYVARTGGVDDQAVLYKNGNNTFSDTKGHWAEGYINYAAAKGFVAGRGNGKFDPDASITGYELMKIALCALGYDSEVEGFVGANWKSNTAALAQEAGLTQGYAADPTAPITRDNAACVFANLVYATTVRYTDGVAYKYVNAVSNEPYTFGKVYLSLVETDGILLANDKVGIESGAALGDGVIGIDVADKDNKFDGKVEKTFNVGKYDIKVPEELLGQNVSVLFRQNSNGNITNIYGVNATTEFNKVLTVSPANMATLTNKNMAGVQVYDNYVEVPTDTKGYNQTTGLDYSIANDATKGNNWGLFNALRPVATRLVDNDGDGVYEFAFQTTLNVAKVSTVSSGSVSLTVYGTNNLSVPTLTATNATGIDGLAKDDYVVVKKYGTQYVVAKCNKFDATVNGFTNGAVPATITLDGVVYQAAGSMFGVYGVADKIIDGRLVGQKGTYYSYAGQLVYTTNLTGIIPNYCLIEYAENSSIEGIRVKALLDTGVTGTYKVAMYNNEVAAKNGDLFKSSGSIGDDAEEILAYSLNSDGTINLWPADTVENPVAIADNAYAKGSALLRGSYYVNASTVAFVQDSVSKLYYVYKGLGTIPSIKSTTMEYIAGDVISGPMHYTNAIFFDSAVFNPDKSTNFYVVTSNVSVIDQLQTCQFTAYLGNEAVTLKASKAVGDIIAKNQKNAIYNFSFDSNGNVSEATLVAEQTKNGFAVSSNDTNSIILATVLDNGKTDTSYENKTSVNVFTVDNNTKYFYVDTVAGTVREASYSDIVKYDMTAITADVNDTFASWALNPGHCTPMCQMSVIEADQDSYIDYVFIYSAPVKSVYKP